MTTERLSLDDPQLTTFSARVTAHGQWQGQRSVVLDRTAFYPESGGQMPDHGTLETAKVIDVQTDEDGQIHHVIEGELPAVGAEVTGVIEARRRRQHMAQHTGQHALSAALQRVAGAPTRSSRLGETACTIDVGRSELSAEELEAAEELVNEVIEADLEVRTWFPPPEELTMLPLRRRPKVDSDVRVVAIGELDLVPCGGTHCTRTGQIGLLVVLGAERYKGMTRVTFAAGQRARRELEARAAVATRVAHRFSSGPLELEAAVDKQVRELDQARAAIRALRGALADRLATELLADDAPLVVATIKPAEAELMIEVGKRIIERTGQAAALATDTNDGTAFFVARGDGSTLDCSALVRAITAAAGGRGGGRPAHAEGRLPAGVDWPALVAAAAPTLSGP